jgi:hypothetical protein
MFLEHLIGSWKNDGYIYQENGRKKMQQKEPVIATRLMKFLEENYSNYSSRALNTSKIDISLKLPLTIVPLIMNVPPIMAIPPYKCVVNIIT